MSFILIQPVLHLFREAGTMSLNDSVSHWAIWTILSHGIFWCRHNVVTIYLVGYLLWVKHQKQPNWSMWRGPMYKHCQTFLFAHYSFLSIFINPFFALPFWKICFLRNWFSALIVEILCLTIGSCQVFVSQVCSLMHQTCFIRDDLRSLRLRSDFSLS